MKDWNPKLEIGDRVILYYMDVHHDIIPLTKGTVTSIQEDPFNDKNDWIYLVNWDSGETVSLLGCVDLWLKDDAD
jgi:hypothetical protein